MRRPSDFLPEVIPDTNPYFPTSQVQSVEQTPSVGLQALPRTYIRDSKQLPEVVVAFGSEATTPDDCSTRGLVAQKDGEEDETPRKKTSLWRRKQNVWVFILAFLLGVLCVVIPVAIVLSVDSNKDSASNDSPSDLNGRISSPTATSAATSSMSTTSSTIPTSTCTNYAGPPLKSLPDKIAGTLTDAGPPPGTVPATFTFKRDYSYDKVAKDGNMQSNIIQSIPQGLAFALPDTTAALAMSDITGDDTAQTKCYITTSVTAYIPSSAKEELQRQARDKSSKLYNSRNGNVQELFQQVDKISVT
ncbi:MAG: hypothetical protein M1831_004653 [Alyxoria varia]|nr:MAG: hypothetical protein M1831_004653 [Alyxoria varia]